MSYRAILLVLSVLSTVSIAAAQSSSLTVTSLRRGKQLGVVIVSGVSGQTCSATLYGGARRTAVDAAGEGTLLGTFDVAESASLSAANIVSLISASRTRAIPRRMFFSALVTCPSQSDQLVTTSVRVPTKTNGRSVARWLTSVKSKLRLRQVKLTEVISGFSLPIDFQAVDTTSALVAEQGGKIWLVDNVSGTTTKQLFLDISSKLVVGGERGLLGLAIHPKFLTNDFFYVNYSESGTGATIIARYKRNSPTSADPNSELRLLRVEQPFENHNGGGLAFGNDGFLYIGLGDGGSGGDPQGNGQNRTTLLGKMLRIDVDTANGAMNYSIPASNPFRGSSFAFKEEIFAYGLRNPFRFSFDATTGKLWAGDVGQNSREEIDIITSGANLGWNITEGNSCYPSGSSCDKTGLTQPIHDYPRSDGVSVTGGYVYRGSAIPGLVGQYVFGDFGSGKIWALAGSVPGAPRSELLSTDLSISSFGQALSGELFVVSYGDGKIYRLDPM